MLNNETTKASNEELTIKDASSKLDISEATVKKYIKDFALPIEKGSGSKALLSDETFQALTEIVKLRANGLSIQEIKELKAQKPSKNILDELEETVSTVKPSTDELVDDPGKLELEGSPNIAIKKITDPDTSNDTSLSQEDKEDSSDVFDKSLEEEGEELEEGQERRKRRGFNYRYVERQIASDSKRVYSLRQRLKNPNLSVRDRLFFEEALERRILFLNGWKHILRWMGK